MCSEPVMRAPFNGFFAPNSSRMAISPGISTSASADFLAAPIGKLDIGDVIILGGSHDEPLDLDGDGGRIAGARREGNKDIKISLYHCRRVEIC